MNVWIFLIIIIKKDLKCSLNIYTYRCRYTLSIHIHIDRSIKIKIAFINH